MTFDPIQFGDVICELLNSQSRTLSIVVLSCSHYEVAVL